MIEDLVVGLAAILIGSGAVVAGIGYWRGWLRPRGQPAPRSYAGRFYLTIPIFSMLVSFGVAIVLDGLGAPQTLSGFFLLVILPLGLLGMVITVWQPERLRPAWQRRSVDLFQARERLLTVAREQGHPFVVFLTVDDDEEPVMSSPDVAEARSAARQALEVGVHAQHATVLDVESAEVIERFDREER